MQVVSKYEIECSACDVKYPPGQKRCVHCGGRTAPSLVDMGEAPPALSEGVGQVVREPEPPQFGDGEEMIFMPAGTGSSEEDASRGGGFRKFGGLLWVAIFAVITLIRACFEE